MIKGFCNTCREQFHPPILVFREQELADYERKEVFDHCNVHDFKVGDICELASGKVVMLFAIYPRVMDEDRIWSLDPRILKPFDPSSDGSNGSNGSTYANLIKMGEIHNVKSGSEWYQSKINN
jgi:hypothetical protein